MKYNHIIYLFSLWFLISPMSKAEPIVVYGGIVPGLHSYQEGGEIEGNIVQALDMLMKSANVDYELRLMNLAQANRQFRKEQKSLYLSMTRLGGNENIFQWILPWTVLDFRVAKLKNNKLKPPLTFQGLKEFNFGVLRGAATEELLKQQGFVDGKHYISMTNTVQLVKLLNEGLVDFVFYEPTISSRVVRLMGYSPDIMEVTNIKVPNRLQIWLAGNKTLPVNIVKKIQQAHALLLKDKKYNSLIKTILPDSITPHSEH